MNRYYALLDEHGEVVVTLPTRRPAEGGEEGYVDPKLPGWDSRRWVDLLISVATGDGRIAGSGTMWDGQPPPWCHEIVFVESPSAWPKGGPRPRETATLWRRRH